MTFTAITHDIKVTVLSEYQSAVSVPDEYNYVYTYQVHIENLGDETIQIMGRHWHVIDTAGLRQEVLGEGVVGETPIIHPGESYEYGSWCKLTAEAGKMWGTYTVKRHSDNRELLAEIPEFMLIPEYWKN